MVLIQFIGTDNDVIGIYDYKKELTTKLSHQDNFDKCVEVCKVREDIFYSRNPDPEDIFDFREELEAILEEAGYERVFIEEEVNTNYI